MNIFKYDVTTEFCVMLMLSMYGCIRFQSRFFLNTFSRLECCLSLSSSVRPYFNWMLLFLHACISFHNKFFCIFCIMNCTAMDSNLEFGSAPLLSLYLDVTISESIKFYSMILKCYTIISQNKAAIHVFIFGIHNQR